MPERPSPPQVQPHTNNASLARPSPNLHLQSLSQAAAFTENERLKIMIGELFYKQRLSDERIATLDEQVAMLKEQLDQKAAESAQAVNQYPNQTAALEERLLEVAAQVVDCQQRLVESDKKKSRLEKEVKQLHENLNAVSEEGKRLQVLSDLAKGRVEMLERENTIIEKQNAGLLQRLKDFQKDISEQEARLHEQVTGRELTIDELHYAVVSLQQKAALQEDRESRLSKELEAQKSVGMLLAHENKNLKALNGTLMAENANFRVDLYQQMTLLSSGQSCT
ncbi:hypothetical protein BDP27DRAFT_1309474 [Rhodocollybia butyracea]|uniref:Uncharacterized protein n=1 Tax=Rhodocollybia butyracea TaxID=206335 RepID=A0A9P5UGF4_9AGAR|nr:hypothetical protein BDP27DRAFT_1309474 [Rhodocollybia butyracea]